MLPLAFFSQLLPSVLLFVGAWFKSKVRRYYLKLIRLFSVYRCVLPTYRRVAVGQYLIQALCYLLHQYDHYRTGDHYNGSQHFFPDILLFKKLVTKEDTNDGGQLKQR